MKKLFYLFLIPLFFGCKTSNEVQNGVWRFMMPTDGGILPFNLEIQKDGENYKVWAINGEERLELDKGFMKNDSLHIPMEIFDGEIIAKVNGNAMSGVYKKMRSDFSYFVAPLTAEFGKSFRFTEKTSQANASLADKYEVVFRSKDGKDSTVSVGLFSQKGNEVAGTFMTTTGDYRYLAGNTIGDSLFLSTFDGNHNYLFKAKIEGDKIVGGGFWANRTGYEAWSGKKNEKAELPDATKLTFLKEGYKGVAFSFKNANHETISLKDEAYRNKVVIIQILGSWCPNCMDETRFLAPWYKKNKERGVEIVGLTYEKSTDTTFAYPKMRKMKERFGMDYQLLLGGTNQKDDASKSLPMLNKVMGFPTTIFIDKRGMVREIHTGFSGPGTGKYYDEFVTDFNRLIDKLLAE